MTDERRRTTLIKGLAVLAVLQVAVLTAVQGEPGAVPIDGTDLSSLAMDGPAGEAGAVGSLDGPTLLLIFHSDCAYCRIVAPEWAEWLKGSPREYGVVAASREPYAEGKAYADEHGWLVDVVSMPSESLGTLAHEVTRRTPWVFALDGEGRVLTSAHGGELAAVASALQAHVQKSDRRVEVP